MKSVKQFTAPIQASDGGGAFIVIPFDVEKTYGKKRVKIKATFDEVPYRGTLVRMGSPNHILIIRKDIRAQIAKQPGDKVKVTLQEDTEPRVVNVPGDFREILDRSQEAGTFFNNLSYTHQREYVEWIENAKKEETRIRRMNKAIEMMLEGKKGV